MKKDVNGDTFSLDRRHAVLGGILCLASAIAYARTPVPHSSAISKKGFEALIPDQVGKWTFETSSGLVLPPPDAMSDRLYDNLVTKIYASPDSSPMMLLVAYSNTQDGVLQVHRPEVCYPAGGYELTPTRRLTIADGVGGKFPANLFTASRPGREEHVLYWTRIGQDFPLGWRDQRLAVIRANLEGNIPDGILVRVSTIAGTVDEALPHLLQFAAQLNRSMPAKGRALLTGN